MANETVFLVICHDRHTDDVITVHRTREGADAKVEAFKSEYPAMQWTEAKRPRGVSWLRRVNGTYDGPSATIETCEVMP